MNTLLALSVTLFHPTASAGELPAPMPAYALQNTGAGFLVGEFVGSAFLGFMGPDLILTQPPDDLSCADAWCDPPGIDVAFSRAFTLDQPRTAGHVSHVFTIGLAPAAVIAGSIVGAAQAKKGQYAVQDTVILLDAFMLSTGLNSIAKVAGRRQRPAFTYGREGVTEAADHPGEEFLSFYSGDTTWAFTLAATGTTLAYLRGYEHAQWIAIGSGALAFTGGFLRIVGDMHWFTDVFVGATIGSAVGVGLPLLLHRRREPTGLTLAPMAGPGEVGIRVSSRF